MQKKNIFVFVGNPDQETLCGSLAHTYIESAKAAGHSVEAMYIHDMKFDPILHKGYKEIQQLEPDLLLFHTRMRAADHVDRKSVV